MINLPFIRFSQMVRLLALAFCLFFLCASDLHGQTIPSLSGDIWIQGGLLIDGTGSEGQELDLLIGGDEIIWIGKPGSVEIEANTVIDAHGMIVAPGFVDMHAHGDPLATPDFQNFLAMGVTTIALGMDGSSERVSQLGTWSQNIRKKRIGVNVLPFIGHGTIRAESGVGSARQVTTAGLNDMSDLLDQALKQGCWGLSMGLEYLPGYYADSVELRSLAQVVGRHNALITSHIRNEDDGQVESSIMEMTRLAKWCRINISHIKVVYGKGSDRAISVLESLGSSGPFPVTADLYPYTASYTGIGIVFPEWAKNPKAYARIKRERGPELAKHLRDRVSARNGPSATLFGNGPYKGRTLADVAEEYQMPYEEVLRDIIGPYGTSAAYFVMDEALQKTLAQDERIAFASDGSPTMYHPRGYGTFSRIIEDYVITEHLLTLEQAVYKMTVLPAKTIGLKDRGQLMRGYKADLVIFDPQRISAKASFDDPHQLSEGMSMVFVNGALAFENQAVLGRYGKVVLTGNGFLERG